MRLIKSFFRVVYGVLAGGLRIRPRNSVAVSGDDREAIRSLERVANWASTWANHMFGSAGKKGGNFKG